MQFLKAALGAMCVALVACGAKADPIHALTMTIAPWGMYHEQRGVGLYVDLSNRIAREAGLEPTQVMLPYARIPASLRRHDRAFTLMTVNPNAEAHGHKVTAVADLKVVVQVDALRSVARLRDLEGLIIATITGTSLLPAFVDNPAIYKAAASDSVNQAKLLLTGRVDGFIGVDQANRYALSVAYRQMGRRRALAPPLMLDTVPAYLWVAQEAAQAPWVAVLKAAADALRARGEIDRILTYDENTFLTPDP